MQDEVRFRELLPLSIPEDREKIIKFLKKHDLLYEEDIEFSVAAIDKNDEVTACGCCAGNILKCFAINEELRGYNILGNITSKLVMNRLQNGLSHLFIFTKPENEKWFVNSGFTSIAKTKDVVLMENLRTGLERFLHNIEKHEVYNGEEIGAIVVNCNPFTLGHLHLIEYAAKDCKHLYIFVVEEDKSIFPFKARFDLVRNGTAHIQNVTAYPSGPYIISNLTFPTYFLKDKTSHENIQNELDAILFSQKIASYLGIAVRYVGQEPNCHVTNSYNKILRRVLPLNGVRLIEIPRICSEAGEIISASAVRNLIKTQGLGRWMKDFLPEVTCKYLMSKEAKPIIDKIISNS
jgi:[citrate (pro-3S)-lyase] ligase